MSQAELDSAVAANLKVYYGCWLVRHRYYDEAKGLLADVDPDGSIHPSALLFCRSVAHYRLLEKQRGLAGIDRLLQDMLPDDTPERYKAVALLMEQDLRRVRAGNLDYISRQMSESGRHLDLGRAGSKVRRIQDDVIAGLNRLIEELEREPHGPRTPRPSNPGRPQDSPGPAAPGNPAAPAPDSSAPPANSPGDANSNQFSPNDWEKVLDPKARAKALQEAAKPFPSHYRDVVEQYFRRIAAER